MIVQFNEKELIDYLTKNHKNIKARLYNDEYIQREYNARIILSKMNLGLSFNLRGTAEIYKILPSE